MIYSERNKDSMDKSKWFPVKKNWEIFFNSTGILWLYPYPSMTSLFGAQKMAKIFLPGFSLEFDNDNNMEYF